MENNEIENVETEQMDSNKMYLDEIKKLKETSVSRAEYNKIVEDNRNLLQAIVDGKTVATEEPVEEKQSLDDLRREIFTGELNNLEYVSKALELRDRVLEETGNDIFVGKGHNLTPSMDAYASAERTANTFREAIEYANGDSELFTQELMRRTADVGLPFSRK